MSQKRARGWLTASGALSVAAGIAVFIAFVWKIGPSVIWAGILNVGWMFPVIIALGGLRFLVRAWAWSICVEPPLTLRLRQAFAAVLTGDAVGNVTPLGPLVGEPAKAAFVRHHLAVQPALTALAVENIFYTLSTAAMIASGTIALLFAFELEPSLREFSQLAVGAIVALLAVSLAILWRQPALISRWLPRMSRPGTRLHSSIGRVRALEDEIYSFAGRRRSAVFPVILLETSFHALGVLETYLAMWMILARPPLLIEAFILETANRLITVAFKFIPFQLGVGEVATAAVTSILGLGTHSGGVLAIVRKARMGVWALVGGALLLRGR
ncbi:MAG TPA: lysylphosphatidylglycerol synthase domain-containing protein [Vicinamibacterales bacterium]|nr:lysylphosphatidylglycerol synthase domain-containing protein [Vicinamibacterales bacterium]